MMFDLFMAKLVRRPQVVPALMEVFGIPLALAAVQAGRRAATAHLDTFGRCTLEISNILQQIFGDPGDPWVFWEYGTLRTSAAHLGIDWTSDIRL